VGPISVDRCVGAGLGGAGVAANAWRRPEFDGRRMEGMSRTPPPDWRVAARPPRYVVSRIRNDPWLRSSMAFRPPSTSARHRATAAPCAADSAPAGACGGRAGGADRPPPSGLDLKKTLLKIQPPNGTVGPWITTATRAPETSKRRKWKHAQSFVTKREWNANQGNN